MARLIRSHDWSNTSLGALETWSETLIATVNILLLSPFSFAVYWGPEMTLLYNDAYRPFLAEKHPAALGGHGPAIWQEAWPVIGEPIERALLHGAVTDAIESYIPILVDGRLQDRWWNYSFYPLYENGAIRGVANPGSDDTPRRLARQSLQAGEAQANRILHSIGDAVIVTDANTLVTRMNPVAEQLTGWSEAEAKDRPLREVFRILDEESRKTAESPTDMARRSGKVSLLDNHTLLLARNGREIPIDDSGAPIFDEQGAVTGTVLVFRDIEQRRAMELEKQRATERLRRVLGTSRDAICSIDRNWKITYLNPAAKRIVGSGIDYVGLDLWRSFPMLKYPGSPFVEHYHRAMDRNQPSAFEALLPAPFNLQVMIDVFPTDDGIASFARDITAQKKAEAALLQTEKLAAVSRLAASVAHEINNPLESVTNLLYLARTSQHPVDIQEYLSIAERELRRVSVISNQTLRFYRQSTNSRLVTCEDLFESVLSIYQGRLVNSQIDVRKRKRACAPFRCFDGEIRQVLNNLVGNAIDAMHPSGGHLLIRSRETHDRKTGRAGIALTVADTGAGMSTFTQSKIFEAFYTTKGIGGTGLGLWVSKEIVDRHQGTLRVRSSEKQGRSGTVFTLFLPFDAAPR